MEPTPQPVSDGLLDDDTDAADTAAAVDPATQLQAVAAIIIGRTSDKAPTVRAKALGVAGELVEAAAAGQHPAIAEALRPFLPQPAADGSSPQQRAPPGLRLTGITARRTHDPRLPVRKAALTVAEAVMSLPWYVAAPRGLCSPERGIGPAATATAVAAMAAEFVTQAVSPTAARRQVHAGGG